MLLVRDDDARARADRRWHDHLRLLRAVAAGTVDPRAVQAAKLAGVLAGAARTPMYRTILPRRFGQAMSATDHTDDPGLLLDRLLPALPMLDPDRLSEHGFATSPANGGVRHHYGGFGADGARPVVPTGLEDGVVDTTNVGEMWARFLTGADVAVVMTDAHDGALAHRIEQVTDYLGMTSVHLGAGEYDEALRAADELAATVFVGPPSVALRLSRSATRRGRPVGFHRLLLVAERAGPDLLRELARLTGATAWVGYHGGPETGAVAVSCEHGRLHVQSHSHVVEVCDEHGARMVDGSPDQGELVVTTLDRPARPLVRYRTGDLAEVTGERCPCGLVLPVIRIRGRVADLAVLDRSRIDPDRFESALWPVSPSGPVALDYLLAVRRSAAVCLVSTDRPVDADWAEETARRLAPSAPRQRLFVRPVTSPRRGHRRAERLPVVLDLADPSGWRCLPASVQRLIRTTLDLSDDVGRLT